MRKTSIVAVLLIGVIGTVCQAQIVTNGSFEEDLFPYPGYAAERTLTGWTFTTGVGTNPSWDGNAIFADQNLTNVPDGTHVAFIQSFSNVERYLSQDIVLSAGVTYELSYYESSRPSTATPHLTVLLGSKTLVAAHDVITDAPTFTRTIATFTVPADGTYTLKFINATAADSAVLLDDISIVATTTPIFSPSVSKVSGPTSITITCMAGASIYYTTNGTTPTTSGTAYTSPVTVSVSGGMTLQAIGVLNGESSDVISQTYAFYPIVENRTGSIETTGSSAGLDLVLQNGSIHVNGNRYRHIVLAGTISNWTGTVSTNGTGIWSFISMMGTDYFTNRNVPTDVNETMNIFSYAGNANYGAADKQRGFAANGGLVLWKGAAAYSVYDGFAAEDCFPDPLGGHSMDLTSNLLTDPTRFEYEIDYDLEALTMTVKVRDVGDMAWDGERSATLGCRNNYSVSAKSDDWSDLVFSVQSSNNLTSDMTTYGFDYTIQMQIYGITAGDANLDDAVDVSDLGILAANYGTTSGGTWNKGDFNGDGAVDVSDLGILAANYGTGSSSNSSFGADYVKVFGMTTSDTSHDKATVATDSSVCSSLGLSLIAGLAMMGLMLMKMEE